MVRPDAQIPHADDVAQHEAAAAALRQERPGWVVIWLARKGEFRVRPLFRAPPDTVATGANTEELTAQMDEIEQAARSPKLPARS
jgi:hypothetical protein